MKRLLGLIGFAAAGTTLALMAQTNTVPPLPDLPGTVSEYWKYAIAALTPIIVWGVRKLVPKIPDRLLAASTPFVGLLLGLALNKIASLNLTWVDMTELGALAVFIREVINQNVTKPIEAKMEKDKTS